MIMVKEIEIPADRHLRLDWTLPESFQAGQAKLTVVDSDTNHQKTRTSIRSLEDCIKEAEERAEIERKTGCNPFEGLKGCLKDSPCFRGRDGMEIQIEMRNEWPD
jgi:16S rRNA U1498 N3-methylase RsmE